MTGSQIKAWRLKRKIGMREWCIMLIRIGMSGCDISYAETGRWNGPLPEPPFRRVEYEHDILSFIRGYEAAEKKLGSAK